MAKITRSKVAWLLTISALAAVAVVAAHKGGHHAQIPKDKAHANVDPSKAGDCPFHAAKGAGDVAAAKEKRGDAQEMRILPIFDEDGNIAGSKAEDDQDQSHYFVDKDAYRRAKDAGEEEVVSSSRMKALFAFLFPGSPMVNSLLGTTYISLIPNLLLYFVPPDIKPESLNTLVAFAVGGLLGDVFLHLLPHSFLGEVHEGELVEVSEVRNVVVGLGLFVGFFIFFCIDKIMRVLSGGEGGHSHSHGHDHGHSKKVDGEDEHHHAHSHDHDHKHEDSTLRQRKGGEVKEGSDKVALNDKDAPKKEISNSIKLSAYLNLIADATHNFTDGLAMAASFYTSPAIGATTTVAVFFHEIPHEVGDYAILIQSGFPRSKAMMSQFITAIGAFLGTFAGIAIEEMSKSKENIVGGVVEAAKPLALFGIESIPVRGGDLVIPFTAGGFLYIATVGVIPELLTVSGKLNKDIRQFGSEIVAMMIGVGMMVVIALNE
ncbi:solute carrier family 39 (zinc transporter), member 7 [Entomortierella parvispora]|uniref:Solute carrier family 39 (Zinc transporter), member 7 n=1 Tax=Entomortierella parvispora TaxID=205924 RepID=A0A9P3HFG4_9FUNG|nr:solute carrier family 39 (zinc transporter), member 7 [Entomortierella parvispora]